MNRLWSLLPILLLLSCSNYGQLNYVAKLPKAVKETSGLAFFEGSSVWTINDGGNKDHIYQISFEGELLRELKVTHAKNRDWEDLASDPEGNLYIGDFGNNSSKREDLAIYILPNPEREKGDKIKAEKIEFHYPDQKKFPPKKKNQRFDAEAMFYRDSSLYIINKNRANPFDGTAVLYRVPARPGKYEAELISRFNTCAHPAYCQITAADISPDGQKIVLLSYGKLWVFTEFEGPDFTKGSVRMIDLGASTQLEGICFTDNQTLLLSDEKKGPTGRNLYSFKLD